MSKATKELHATAAKSILSFYFRMLCERTGIGWNMDNQTSIEWAIDELIAAASRARQAAGVNSGGGKETR